MVDPIAWVLTTLQAAHLAVDLRTGSKRQSLPRRNTRCHSVTAARQQLIEIRIFQLKKPRGISVVAHAKGKTLFGYWVLTSENLNLVASVDVVMDGVSTPQATSVVTVGIPCYARDVKMTDRSSPPRCSIAISTSLSCTKRANFSPHSMSRILFVSMRSSRARVSSSRWVSTR
jgi:hypothetical protein